VIFIKIAFSYPFAFHRPTKRTALAIAAFASASDFRSACTSGWRVRSNTTTIDGHYLPSPPKPFQGEIGLNAAQSRSAWPAGVVPPKDAPNILLVTTDDVVIGAPATFGGVIPTPTLDRIAADGLRYTSFHSTAKRAWRP
jgi:Sulfatase